jgi:hypothetical protein
LRARSQPDHAEPAQYLYGQNPTLSPSDLWAPHGVHNGTPQQLQAVWVGCETVNSNLSIAHVIL